MPSARNPKWNLIFWSVDDRERKVLQASNQYDANQRSKDARKVVHAPGTVSVMLPGQELQAPDLSLVSAGTVFFMSTSHEHQLRRGYYDYRTFDFFQVIKRTGNFVTLAGIEKKDIVPAVFADNVPALEGENTLPRDETDKVGPVKNAFIKSCKICDGPGESNFGPRESIKYARRDLEGDSSGEYRRERHDPVSEKFEHHLAEYVPTMRRMFEYRSADRSHNPGEPYISLGHWSDGTLYLYKPPEQAVLAAPAKRPVALQPAIETIEYSEVF
jgi:hypothetical protein